MATFKLYKLHFTAPLHVGDRKDNDYGVSLKSIASDSMYAALTACLAKVGYPIPDDGDLGVAISSLFPYYQSDLENSEPIYFLPMPIQPISIQGKVDSTSLKKVKKVKWIDASLYSEMLKGKSVFGQGDTQGYIHEEYFTAKDIDEGFVVSQVNQRVKLESRIGDEDALPYYVDQVLFKEKSGLFFIACGDTSLLDKALPILAQEGLGTDRNVGNGFFEYETSTITLDTCIDADHVTSLSMFIPESKEQVEAMLDSERTAYDFERRGGWVTTYPHNTLRKNVVYSFTPGSVFSCKASCDKIMGRIVDLKPTAMQGGHPIWRCGKAIFLPIK